MNNKYYIVSYDLVDDHTAELNYDYRLGLFSSREKAQEAIKKELERLNLYKISSLCFKDKHIVYTNRYDYYFLIEECNLDEANPIDTFSC